MKVAKNDVQKHDDMHIKKRQDRYTRQQRLEKGRDKTVTEIFVICESTQVITCKKKSHVVNHGSVIYTQRPGTHNSPQQEVMRPPGIGASHDSPLRPALLFLVTQILLRLKETYDEGVMLSCVVKLLPSLISIYSLLLENACK